MLHPSRIFVLYLVLFLFFVTLSEIFKFNSGLLGALALAFLILSVFLFKHKFLRYILLILFVVSLAISRVSEVTPSDNSDWITTYIGQERAFEGRVADEAKVSGKSQQLTLKIEGIKGNIQVSTNQFPTYEFGDTLKVTGQLKDLNPDSEEYRGYFKSRNIYAFMSYPDIAKIEKSYPISTDWYYLIRKPLLSVRQHYESAIGKILPEPEAGLLSGIILGSRANLPDDFLLLLSLTGTIHIIALSGYNITIVAEFMRILARRISFNASFYLPVIGITAFVLATGLSASVIRAAIMGFLMLLAKKLRRQTDALVSVMLASAVMVYINPHILLYDIGFQLSFAAVSGMLFLAPAIERYFLFLGRSLGQMMAATFAAQIFSWPVVSYYFGVVSIISPLANLLILPIIPPVMLVGFIASSLALVSLWLGKILGIVLWVVLSYFTKVIEILGDTTYAASNIKISLLLVIGYYLLLFDIVLILKRVERKKFFREIVGEEGDF